MPDHVVPCPRCGGQLLVFQPVEMVVVSLGAGEFHEGRPFGTPRILRETSPAACNMNGCDWSGKLVEAVAAVRAAEATT